MSPARSGIRRQPIPRPRPARRCQRRTGHRQPACQCVLRFYAGKADASLFNEASQVVLVRDGERTVLSMLNDYSGPLNEFALVVPTPTVLQQGGARRRKGHPSSGSTPSFQPAALPNTMTQTRAA